MPTPKTPNTPNRKTCVCSLSLSLSVSLALSVVLVPGLKGVPATERQSECLMGVLTLRSMSPECMGRVCAQTSGSTSST